MARHILKIWGGLDILCLAIYIGRSILGGRTPFLADFQASKSIGMGYGTSMPMILSSFGMMIMASLAFSGYGLWKKKAFGRWLVYLQTPFRLVLAMPSIFFIGWLFPQSLSRDALVVVGMGVLVVLTEAYKVFSVHRAYSQA